MNYDWLTTTLRTAEASMWLSEGSRQVLSAFRVGLEWETDPFENVCDENTVIAIVNDHREVFEQMKKWDDSPQPEHVRLAEIFRGSESLDVKATQQLYKVYWQKWYLWAECLPMLAYAGLLKAARDVFSDVQRDMHRKGVHFSRPSWAKVGAPAVQGATNYWPMAVCVYPEPRHRAGDEKLFRAVTYLVPNRWHPALQVDPVIRLLDGFRKRSMRPTTWDFTSADHTLAITRDIAEHDVAGKLTTHMCSGRSKATGWFRTPWRTEGARRGPNVRGDSARLTAVCQQCPTSVWTDGAGSAARRSRTERLGSGGR